jgi:hypothetical protein
MYIIYLYVYTLPINIWIESQEKVKVDYHPTNTFNKMEKVLI